jgi:protein tyrosine phosphatase (PTP) superfamily phosphohydrolase (DUF442 family)
MKILRLTLTASLIAALQGWSAAPATVTGVPRFLQVNENLFRGGQPTAQGFEQLKGRGVRTVVNLRVEDSERELVEALGMKYIHIPIAMPIVMRPWKTIPEADIAAFFRAIDDPENQPAFVHCHRGADRTGMLIGMYRIARDHWDGARAYREAREIGLRWWFRSFKEQLLRFARPSVPVGKNERSREVISSVIPALS